MQYQREFPVYLSATKIKKHMEEWDNICKNKTFVEKIVEPVGNLLVSYIVSDSDAVQIQSSSVTKSVAAETLLRCYYHGHKTLGTDTVDAAVAKASRAGHVRNRNNAGPARRALALYEQFISRQLTANPNYLDFGIKTHDIHDRVLPSKLLTYLKNDLLQRGKPLNLKGALAAVIFVIQDKCNIQVINLETINSDIAAAKAQNVPSANHQSSFWSKLNPVGYWSGSSRKEVLPSSNAVVSLGDDECDSSEASL